MRQRGSTLLIVLVIVGATTMVVIAAADLVIASMTSQWRKYHETHARYIADAVVEYVQSKRAKGALSLPTTLRHTIDGVTATAAVRDNSVNMKRSLLIDITVTEEGLTYKDSRVVGDGFAPKHFYYALATVDNLYINNNLTTASSRHQGHVYVGNSLRVGSARLGGGPTRATIDGDLEVVGSLAGTPNVWGSTWLGAPSITWPAPSVTDYAIGARIVLTGSMSNYSFTNTALVYETVMSPMTLRVSGTFEGRGVVFVASNIVITGDIYYKDGNALVAFIAKRDIIVSRNVKHIDGYFYAGNRFFQNSSSLTVGRGAIVAKRINLRGDLVVNYDHAVWDDPTEGWRLKLPGFYP